MLGLGLWEIVLIAVIVLIVVGPEKLPDFARTIARFINEFKRTTEEFKKSFDDSEMKELLEAPKEAIEDLKDGVNSYVDSQKADFEKLEKKSNKKLSKKTDNNPALQDSQTEKTEDEGSGDLN